jgi:hypothetical protein
MLAHLSLQAALPDNSFIGWLVWKPFLASALMGFFFYGQLGYEKF